MTDPLDFSRLREPFDRSGFVHIRGFLSTTELMDVHRHISDYKEQIAPHLEDYRVLYDVQGEQRCIKHMVHLDKEHAFFSRMLEGKAHALATALLGENALPENVEYFDKGPRIGKPTPAHQDGYYFCLKPNHAITLWIALDNCDEANGCMSYVPGSHKHGVLDHRPSGVVGFSQGLDTSIFDGRALFVARGCAGDCFAHHSLTIHLAGANESDRHRQSIGLIYYGESARRDEDAFARYKANVEQQRKLYPVRATA